MKKEGDRMLVADDFATAWNDEATTADKIRQYASNVYIRKYVQQQMSLVFGEGITVEAFTPDDVVDEVLTKKFNKMVRRKTVNLDSKMPASFYDNIHYGIGIVNPVWGTPVNDKDIQLLEADILPAYSFRNAPSGAAEGTVSLSKILQGIMMNKKGVVEYYQTQSDGEVRQVKNVVPIRNPLSDMFVASPMFEPIYSLIDMSAFTWETLMQHNNRNGTGGSLYLTVKAPGGDDEAFAQDIIEARGKECGHVLRENMIPIFPPDNNNTIALETIRELHNLHRSYFSPADILQQREGGSIGGSDYAELELLLADVAAKHRWLAGGWQDVLDQYFTYNQFDEGYYTKIYIPTISIDKAKVWLEQAKAGHEMGVLFDNEKRDLLERKELSDDELAKLKTEQGTPALKPAEAASLMSTSPLYPEKGIEAYTKYLARRKTKQTKITPDDE